jgi:S1-C subfamily serine protease
MLAGYDVSQGSAVAVSKQELITNCHVVENAPFIVVIQKDHVTEAKLVKSNPASDRCIIRVGIASLSPIQGVRTFSDLSVGERVYSVGTPSGLEQTLGEGLISGLRENKGVKLIQTTAPISPGSSGGGLFDASGNLIGVTTFMLRDTQALNFAIAAEQFWH